MATDLMAKQYPFITAQRCGSVVSVGSVGFSVSGLPMLTLRCQLGWVRIWRPLEKQSLLDSF